MPVVVTGMDCLCAAGDSPAMALHGLTNASKSLASARLLGTHALPYPFFAVADTYYPGGRRHTARDTLSLAQRVVGQAMHNADVLHPCMQRNAGVVWGTTAGSALHFLESYAASRAPHNADTRSPTDMLLSKVHHQNALQHDIDDYFAANLALELVPHACGPRLTLTNACTSGADAIGIAMDLITTGQCPYVICGGADALSLVPHTGFVRLMIYSDKACRPFDVNRDGLNLGEGAAALVLEDEAHARRRNAPILGRVLGYGSGADAYHFTAPHPEGRGLAAAIAMALGQAGLDSADVAFINAHGTATRENDKVEGRLLHTMLPHVAVWGSKGGTGHTLGAAGALEAVLTLAALEKGFVPVTQGFATVDPEIGFAPTCMPRPVRTPFALSTSLGFGGGNAALVLAKATI